MGYHHTTRERYHTQPQQAFVTDKMTTSNEYLLHNHIGKELQEVLKPFIITEKVIIASKYTIRDNFLTSNTRQYVAVSAIMNTIFCIIHAILFYKGNKGFWVGFASLLVLGVVNILSAILECFINFMCGVMNSETVAQILLKVQAIDTKLQTKSLLPLATWRRQKVIVWSLFLGTCVTQLTTAAGNIYVYGATGVGLIQLYSTISKFFFDINILYVILFVDFLRVRLEAWTAEVSYFQEALQPYTFLNKRAKTQKDLDVHGLFKIFSLMTEVVELVQKVFGLSIIFYFVEVFFFCLLFVQYGILMNIYGVFLAHPLAYISLVHYLCWVVKIFVLVVVLSASCERGHSSLRRCRSVCLLVFMNTNNEAVRRMCKNVVRVSGVRYVALSARGVFTVDATLPMRVSALVATYTVVLLQFALL